jgi:hypothetical protein
MEFGTVLFLMLLSGVVGTYVADRCRQTMLEGFVHGALFGPIGWLLLALYPIQHRARPGDKVSFIPPIPPTPNPNEEK